MSLVEKYALLPDEIDRESLVMVEASLPDSLSFSGNERYVVSRIVRAEGILTAMMHGGKVQADRENNLRMFKNGSVSVLVATDVAGRGLDLRGNRQPP